MADKLIDQVLGRYKILKDIDKGGMGKVYLAEHIFTHKKVALKTLLM
jgi:serine/threonine protein kinase